MTSMIAWWLAACADPDAEGGKPGPAGDPADPEDPTAEEEEEEEDPPVGEPSIALGPDTLFPGRTADLRIRGEGTTWTDGVTVAVGPDLIAGAVTVAAPNELNLTVEIDADAPFGPRHVVVTDGAQVLTASVEIVPSLAFTQLYGTQAQGSLLFVMLDNLDTEPFDLRSSWTDEGHPGVESLEFDHLEVVTPYGITAPLYPGFDTTRWSVGAAVTLDVDAATGPFEIRVVSGPQQRVYRSEAIDVLPRTAIPLEPNVPVEGTIVNFGDSVLYRYGSGPSIVEIVSAPIGNSDDPWLQVTGPEGSLAADAIGFATVVGATAEAEMYIVVTDGSGFSANLEFSLVARSAPLGTAFTAETSDTHDTIETAQPVLPPITVAGGALDLLGPAGGYEDDWYRITIGPDDADRSLALSTSSEETGDTRIRVLSEDGLLLVDQDTEGSPLFTYHETVFVPPLGEGTFYVIVSAAGPEYPWPMPYDLALAFEGP